MILKIKDGRDSLWQWDVGRKIVVNEHCDIVHFSNLRYGKALPVAVQDGEAFIPDELLQISGVLYCYVFVGTVDDGYTMREEHFEIEKKPKPNDYLFTPTEYVSLTALDKRVTILEEKEETSGFSPTIEVFPLANGHRVQVTDVNGVQSFDVLNGKNGKDGYTPVKGIDYFTAEDKEEIVNELANKAPVQSVNGKNGVVELSAEDVGALPDDTQIPEVPENISAFRNDVGYLTKHQSLEEYAKTEDVNKALDEKQDVLEQFVESVNGYSGKVSLSASDVKALPDSTVIPTVPTNVSAFTNDADYTTRSYVSEVLGGKCAAYTFGTTDDLDAFLANTENVSKLNTGDLLYIRDVGVPDYWWDGETQSKQILETTKVDLTDYAKVADIPTKTSQLTNDSGFATEASVDTKLGAKQDKLTSYVASVNGKSGNVTLNASDVGALPATTVIPPSYEPFYIDCIINQNGGVFSAIATSDTPTQAEVDAAFAQKRPIYLRWEAAGFYVALIARTPDGSGGFAYSFVLIVGDTTSTMQFFKGSFNNTSFVAQEKIAIVSSESEVQEGKITVVV